MTEWRCTRSLPYTNPNCSAHANPRDRQGHYINAECSVTAIIEMHKLFPDDLEEYREWFESTNQPREEWAGPFTVEKWNG